MCLNMLRDLMGQRRADPNGITVYLIERLGNQLFAYSTALRAARRLGVPCYANLGFFRGPRPKRNYEKVYALGGFASDLVVPLDDRYHRPLFLAQPMQTYSRVWYRYLSRLAPTFGAPPVFAERSNLYDARIEDVEPGTTLLGGFQSWRYFDDIREEIQARLTALTHPSEWYSSAARDLRPGSGAIALNVRRGDYMLPQQQVRQGLVGRGYYLQAARLLRQMGLDGPIYVASDSLSVALGELRGLKNVVPIDPPPGTDPLEVLVLLSRADGLAIGNSTFSWWAAYLGARPEQVVVAPRPWVVRSGRDTRDLLPRSWLTLDRDACSSADLERT
jgi:hypothetical protein